MEPNRGLQPVPRIALALSGGGFRAALFHLGVIRRLAEEGWLTSVDVVSSVSGGSILAAFMLLRWKAVIEQPDQAQAFESLVQEPFCRLVSQRNFIKEWAMRLPTVPLRKLFDRSFTRTSLAAELFDEVFYPGGSWTSLPTSPYLVVNATTLESMRAWRFTRDGMGDSLIGHSPWDGQPMSLGGCVSASAAFPPVFPPMRIDAAGRTFSGPLYGETPLPKRKFVALTDGGVYDNLGVEALIKPTQLPGRKQAIPPAQFLIVSDAGAPTPRTSRQSGLPALSEALLLYRSVEIAREQVSALRRRELMTAFLDQNNQRNGLLLMLGGGAHKLPDAIRKEYLDRVESIHQVPGELLRKLRAVRTHLDRFDENECRCLMYHGYTQTDCFLWAYREAFPAPYRVNRDRSPTWRIPFNAETIASWDRSLSQR